MHCSVKQLGSPLTNGDTLGGAGTFKKGGHALISAILATPFAGRFAVYGSQGLGRGARQDAPGSARRLDAHHAPARRAANAVDIAPAPAVLRNLEAFADAAEGRAPYPVPREQMIANVSALEAVFRSAKSGAHREGGRLRTHGRTPRSTPANCARCWAPSSLASR